MTPDPDAIRARLADGYITLGNWNHCREDMQGLLDENERLRAALERSGVAMIEAYRERWFAGQLPVTTRDFVAAYCAALAGQPAAGT